MRRTGILLALFLLAACSAHVTQAPAAKQDFTSWLADFKKDAQTKGVTPATLNEAFATVQAPSDAIIQLDHKQPESTKTFEEYVHGAVSVKRVQKAKLQWESHKEIFERIESIYHVPAPILLSLWGSESNFGANQGNHSVIESLATLAYDGRRSAFFRTELIDALLILQQEHKRVETLTGSWAGAMGQTQFMPSSFLKFAVDFDGDGVRDIWNSNADVLASIANYLHQKNWDSTTGWGITVHLPPNMHAQDIPSSKIAQSMQAWSALGFTCYDGSPLPTHAPLARLVLPDGNPEYAFLVYPNYDVIMDWNHSTYFATSIGLLADAIARQ